ncbi:hypothetical protein [Micromonospora sp. LOL_024]
MALALQFWHHIEHALLLVQAHSSFWFPGTPSRPARCNSSFPG